MAKLTRQDLYSLERYAEVRTDFRHRVIAHKKNRRLALDEHVTLYFEDVLTVQYQSRKCCASNASSKPPASGRTRCLWRADSRRQQLEGHLHHQYADEAERKRALARMIGIEQTVWMQVDGFDPVYAIANEDIDRSAPDKTASVHFLRFELTSAMRAAAKGGSKLSAGIDLVVCQTRLIIPDNMRAALVDDLA